MAEVVMVGVVGHDDGDEVIVVNTHQVVKIVMVIVSKW